MPTRCGSTWRGGIGTSHVGVETAQAYRGEGIATSLYHAALAQLPQVLHARPEHRTADGNGWAEAVGGDTEDYDEEEEEVYA